MLDKAQIRVQLGSWQALQPLAAPIRLEVFVHEQNVPLEEELDIADNECIHAVAFNPQGVAIGTGRLLPDGHIGRMSVLQPYRGYGVGGLILLELIKEARVKGFKEVVLSAQMHALSFYQQFGFVEEGEDYLDANIPHKTMRLGL